MNTFESEQPTFTEALIFTFKARGLMLRRAFQNLITNRVKRHAVDDHLEDHQTLATSSSILWTEGKPEELDLTAGKVHNLRAAVRYLNGIEIPAGATFSFWKQVGKANRKRGFVAGRELREGCIIPTVGGGLCQLSNALYDAALKAGFEILERHAHTKVIPGSLAEQGRDATVFWNYVDLRFRSDHSFRIEASLDTDHLTIEIKGKRPRLRTQEEKAKRQKDVVHNCLTCNRQDCFRNKPTQVDDVQFGETAWVLDKVEPEFDFYLLRTAKQQDRLYLPLDGHRWGKPAYAWSALAFDHVSQVPMAALKRSRAVRKTPVGGKLQKTLFEHDRQVAAQLAKKIPYTVKHLVISQNLLPHLWKMGALGGRTFDVLMTRLPFAQLQERLDEAAQVHPGAKTLSDFRVDHKTVAIEQSALKAARKLITMHSGIAALFPERAVRLNWQTPTVEKPVSKEAQPVVPLRVFFPASSLGRKGAYEVREGLKGLPIRLRVAGRTAENDQFWAGRTVTFGKANWQSETDLMVLPAWVEHVPRMVLEAIALGIPVIVSKACGLGNVPGIIELETLDAETLRLAVMKHLPTTLGKVTAA